MNILFIGPYRQNDGWGFAARDYIRAMDTTSHTISCKPIFMGQPDSAGLHPSIMKKERLKFDGRPDVVIQNVLPPYLDYQHGMKNIALCYFETENLRFTGWIEHINLMDEIWVASNHEKNNLERDGVTIPIKVVPIPIDIVTLNACKEKWPIAYAENSFIFYTISEYSERKNIQALIVAFYREFYHMESVQLLLKLHKPGLTEKELYEYLASEIWKIKKKMRLYQNNWGYHEILLAIQKLSPQNLISVHNQGDCFVMPSRGESLCRPLMDALYIGNRVISTNCTGMDDVTIGAGAWSVDSMMQPAMAEYPPLKNLYTGYELWADISIPHLQTSMRAAYEHWKADQEKISRPWMERYSYESIGKKIEEAL